MTDEYENEEEEYEDEEATSESEEEEYEDEAEDAEASDESEEDEDSVESWGYEEKKSRFSKEMIAGFAAIAVLVAIFGIVVYKKMPGGGDSAEVATAPDASLGNPEGTLGNPDGAETPPAEDPNDPFREGAENTLVAGDLGAQTEPGLGDGTTSQASNENEFGTSNSSNAGVTDFGSTGTSSETASLFPNEGSNGQGTPIDPFGSNASLENSEPFASNSESPDLFSGQSEPSLSAGSEDPFGTSGTSTATDEFGRPLAGNETGSVQLDPLATQPGNSSSTTDGFASNSTSEFADSSRPDPFGGPDLSSGAASSDPFIQGDQLAQSGSTSDGSLENSFSGDPGSIGSADQFGSSTSNEPFGTTSDSALTNQPFDTESGVVTSEPTGLFDRSSETSLDTSGTGESAFSADPLSSSEFGSESLPGTAQPGTTDDGFGTVVESSPAMSNDPFGAPSGTASNNSFSNSTSQPATDFGSENTLENSSSQPGDLSPSSSSELANTASNDPFQPPLTSSADSSFPSNEASPISSGPFGNEPFDSGNSVSSSTPSTFASQPANSGTYTIKDGDSYWNISRKIYGTAKYFQVLADHNRGTIADPQKMKAGVTIETPPASALQRKLRTVRRTAPTGLAGRVEPSGRADGAGSVGSRNSVSSTSESVIVSRPQTKPNEPSGILFNEQGYPLYRIGETDTLTSIASNHLGRASRWQQVYNMNRDQLQSPDKLKIGMLLKLPADASRVPLVDRTSSLR